MKKEVKVYSETRDNVVFSAYVHEDVYMALATCEEMAQLSEPNNNGLFVSWEEFSDFISTDLGV